MCVSIPPVSWTCLSIGSRWLRTYRTWRNWRSCSSAWTRYRWSRTWRASSPWRCWSWETTGSGWARRRGCDVRVYVPALCSVCDYFNAVNFADSFAGVHMLRYIRVVCILKLDLQFVITNDLNVFFCRCRLPVIFSRRCKTIPILYYVVNYIWYFWCYCNLSLIFSPFWCSVLGWRILCYNHFVFFRQKINNLDSLTTLTSLYLAKNKINKIENLDKLTNLRILSLQVRAMRAVSAGSFGVGRFWQIS